MVHARPEERHRSCLGYYADDPPPVSTEDILYVFYRAWSFALMSVCLTIGLNSYHPCPLIQYLHTQQQYPHFLSQRGPCTDTCAPHLVESIRPLLLFDVPTTPRIHRCITTSPTGTRYPSVVVLDVHPSPSNDHGLLSKPTRYLRSCLRSCSPRTTRSSKLPSTSSTRTSPATSCATILVILVARKVITQCVRIASKGRNLRRRPRHTYQMGRNLPPEPAYMSAVRRPPVGTT
jgi:hypothetical protein